MKCPGRRRDDYEPLWEIYTMCVSEMELSPSPSLLDGHVKTQELISLKKYGIYAPTIGQRRQFVDVDSDSEKLAWIPAVPAHWLGATAYSMQR